MATLNGAAQRESLFMRIESTFLDRIVLVDINESIRTSLHNVMRLRRAPTGASSVS
jgi:hypothetical protein